MDPGFFIRELFHLHVLRQLASRLARRPYAVKGGICLRFFHQSPRLSEDMDIDVSPRVPVPTLANTVHGILSGPVLSASLRVHGVTGIAFTAPKQTETTQRWKASLTLTTGETLSTRIEFSRRQAAIAAAHASPTSELLRNAYLPPFVAAHYNAPSMVIQKINALSSPSRTAARDLFDLHHLWTQIKQEGEFSEERMEPAVIEKALQKIDSFTLRDMREQVFPFLPENWPLSLDSAAAFEAMKERVGLKLEGLLP